jgi:tetratricopeptide (TPR) repeat protein
VIRVDPKDGRAFTSRGVAYDAKGDHDQPIDDYSEAIRLNPKDAMAFNNRGRAYEKKGDHGRAITDYSEAIRLNPNFAIAFYSRGRAYDAKGDHDQAIDDYSEAIRLRTPWRSTTAATPTTPRATLPHDFLISHSSQRDKGWRKLFGSVLAISATPTHNKCCHPIV